MALVNGSRISLMVLMLGVSGIVLAACSPVAVSDTQTDTATPAPSAVTNNSVVADNVKTFEIEAGSFYFKPDVIQVKKGDTVRIVFKSVSMMHNFYVDELNVKGPTVGAGETQTFEFVADKAGMFESYCGIGQHRQQGQVGKVIVEG